MRWPEKHTDNTRQKEVELFSSLLIRFVVKNILEEDAIVRDKVAGKQKN